MTGVQNFSLTAITIFMILHTKFGTHMVDEMVEPGF